MKALKILLVLAIIVFFAPDLSAQINIDIELSYPKLKLDLPLFDLPYQIDAMNTVGKGFFGSYLNPSMSQSLAVTVDFFSGFHFGMKYFYENSNIRDFSKEYFYYAGITLGDFILFYLPGGNGWLHEEYHRAVMSRYDINSFNGMNLFPIGAEIVSVSEVADEGLISLKEKSPADLVRLHAAGIEGEYLLIHQLQRNNFFYDQKLFNEFVYWVITVNSHAYIFMSSSPDGVDVETQKMYENEGTVASRDFTGFDMTAWVYDLFRPDEPYEARGPHPSGEGINRYRTTRDLTDDELKYLKGQFYWHFINYVSPMLFVQRSIPLGDSGLMGNFAMRHLLASFGTAVSAQVFLQYEPFNMAFTYHSYLNYGHYFPAIEAELVNFPLHFGKFKLFLSPRIIFGMQPENQKFKTENPKFFGLIGLRADFSMNKYFFRFIDFTAKTAGWVAGNEYLGSNVSIRYGISVRF